MANAPGHIYLGITPKLEQILIARDAQGNFFHSQNGDPVRKIYLKFGDTRTGRREAKYKTHNPTMEYHASAVTCAFNGKDIETVVLNGQAIEGLPDDAVPLRFESAYEQSEWHVVYIKNPTHLQNIQTLIERFTGANGAVAYRFGTPTQGQNPPPTLEEQRQAYIADIVDVMGFLPLDMTIPV